MTKELHICKDCIHKTKCNKTDEDCKKYSFDDNDYLVMKNETKGKNISTE